MKVEKEINILKNVIP